MAYDAELVDRIRELVAPVPGVTEKRMFGGLTFLIGGHMAVAASRDGGLLARFRPELTGAMRAEPFTDPFVMRGREMDGWIKVLPDGLRTEAQLGAWVLRGVEFAGSLPPKPAGSG